MPPTMTGLADRALFAIGSAGPHDLLVGAVIGAALVIHAA